MPHHVARKLESGDIVSADSDAVILDSSASDYESPFVELNDTAQKTHNTSGRGTADQKLPARKH